jgi:hypothetical protein
MSAALQRIADAEERKTLRLAIRLEEEEAEEIARDTEQKRQRLSRGSLTGALNTPQVLDTTFASAQYTPMIGSRSRQSAGAGGNTRGVLRGTRFPVSSTETGGPTLPPVGSRS